jgi:hypothetical protein
MLVVEVTVAARQREFKREGDREERVQERVQERDEFKRKARVGYSNPAVFSPRVDSWVPPLRLWFTFVTQKEEEKKTTTHLPPSNSTPVAPHSTHHRHVLSFGGHCSSKASSGASRSRFVPSEHACSLPLGIRVCGCVCASAGAYCVEV